MPIIDTGERIRALRKQRNMSQDELAELASLNRVTIAKYESGRVEPGVNALARIADALEVSADVLLGRAEEPAEPIPHPRTDESKIISECVDRMTKEDRERVLAIFKAAYANYFPKDEERIS